MSYAIGVPILTQCQTASISWAGPDKANKTLQAFVQGTNFFAETLDSNFDLTGSVGVVPWLVDMPAGLSVAVEIRDLGNSSRWSTSQYTTIQPGINGSCLGKNSGQLAASSMASFASSLYTASPTLFPYLTTKTAGSTTNPTAAPTSNSTTYTNTTSSATSQPSSKSSSPANGGAIAGGVIGALAIVFLLGVAFYFFRRASRAASGTGSGDGGSRAGSSPGLSKEGGGAVGAGARKRNNSLMNPVEVWRRAMAHRPPSTGTYVYSPATPSPEEQLSKNYQASVAGGRAMSEFGAGASQYGPMAGVPEVQDVRGGGNASLSSSGYSNSINQQQQRGNNGNQFYATGHNYSQSYMPAEVMDENLTGSYGRSARQGGPARLPTPGAMTSITDYSTGSNPRVDAYESRAL
ncbi:hypothetical protein T439DRAFT_383022 [Meredithblackwellia eburnea MCA 4105]